MLLNATTIQSKAIAWNGKQMKRKLNASSMLWKQGYIVGMRLWMLFCCTCLSNPLSSYRS